jgi:hypothetical protein
MLIELQVELGSMSSEQKHSTGELCFEGFVDGRATTKNQINGPVRATQGRVDGWY